MPGTDLQREALDVALRHVPPEVGCHVFCQIITAPAANGRPGEIPAWFVLLTMSNPAALTGPKLRGYYLVGNGAPDLAAIQPTVTRGLAELRELARQKLAEAS
jgi:hypothetical protein